MATKRRIKKIEPQAPRSFFDDLSPHTKQAIGAVFFVVLAVFFALSIFDYAGVAGEYTYKGLKYLFGVGSVLPPVICLLFVFVLLKPREDERVSISKILGIILFFIAILGFISLTFSATAGGFVGDIALWPLMKFFGSVVSGVTLFSFMLIGLFLTFNTNIISLFRRDSDTDELEEVDPIISVPALTPEELALAGGEQELGDEDEEEPKKQSFTERIGLGKKEASEFLVSSFRGQYAPPPLLLLSRDKGKPDVGDVKENSNTIKRTLKKFNIDVEMDEVTIASSVTRYAIKPAEGVKLERITALHSTLEYALAASPLRIEAPIPGKSLVGIEVPNKHRQMIGLASIFSSPKFTDSPKPLLVALGKSIVGEPEFADIARMPHGLIAGTTGSGKSVALHNLIISLLFRNSPDQLRFIMVDPKRVELTLYNGIPHLLTPVITDAKRVILALKHAIKEMERRLDILQEKKIQNIASYHETIYNPARIAFEEKGSPEEEREELPEPLPYIVIIIDELADLMSAFPKELEACIVRLAQKSRAIGIHLVLATQRPSVNVITGLIKANIPTRLALQVISNIDSRTILDQSGAEKLLGKGDMLFLSAESPKPMRIQSAFVTRDEIMKVVDYLKNQSVAQELDSIQFDTEGKESGSSDAFFSSSVDDEDEDDLYEDAKQIVIETGKASTSFLQRKLGIGYSRAAKLIDILEERGVIGPGNGSKPRQVLAGGEMGSPEDIPQ